MSCYLCAYGRCEVPRDHQPLPDGSKADPAAEVGTSAACGVWACPSHGTRYALFKCAICEAAPVVEEALTTGAEAGPEAAHAFRVGQLARSELRSAVAGALARVAGSDRSAPPAGGLAAREAAEPDLVTNLAAIIAEQAGLDGAARGYLAAASELPERQVSVDAIGAVVRARFAGRALAEPTDEWAAAVTGAMLLNYSIADQGVSARRATDPLGWPPAVEALPTPWAATDPVLLEPNVWLVGTALQLGR